MDETQRDEEEDEEPEQEGGGGRRSRHKRRTDEAEGGLECGNMSVHFMYLVHLGHV